MVLLWTLYPPSFNSQWQLRKFLVFVWHFPLIMFQMCTAHCAGMTWAGNKAWNPISSTSEWISKAAHYSCSLPIELTQSLTCRILVIQYIVQRSVWIFIIIFKSQCSVFKCCKQAFFCDSVQSFEFCACKLKISIVLFFYFLFIFLRYPLYANYCFFFLYFLGQIFYIWRSSCLRK